MKSKFLIFITLLLFLPLTILAAGEIPDFILKDINDNPVKFSELLGKGPIIIDFWASWCKPCMKELPELSSLQTKYDTLITIVCISADRPRSVARAKGIVKSKQFSFITLFDQNREVQKLFNITSIPRTFIVNKNGEIVYEHTGYRRGDEKHLEEELLKILSVNTGIDTLNTQEEKNPENVKSIENKDSVNTNEESPKEKKCE